MEDKFTRSLRPTASTSSLRKREMGFYVGTTRTPLPTYSALKDDGLWHFWASPALQSHFQQVGFLSREGQLCDIDRERRKAHVMEHELFLAEELDRRRQRDATFGVEQTQKLRDARKFQRARDLEVRRQIEKIRNQRLAKYAPVQDEDEESEIDPNLSRKEKRKLLKAKSEGGI